MLPLLSNSYSLIIIISIGVFHINISWWSFTGVWVTASLLKSPSYLAVLNNVVWMVSTRPPTYKSSSPIGNPLVTVPKAPITIDIIVTFMFHSFIFNSLARSRYFSFFSHFFSFILWSAGKAKSTILQILFFCWLLLSLLLLLLLASSWRCLIDKPLWP